MMNTTELKYILTNYKCSNQTFVNVIAADELPKRVHKKPSFYIVNTENRGKKGKHWVVFHFPTSNNPEFFDSLGHESSFYNEKFQYLLIREGYQYKRNTVRLQNYNSVYCGLYCLLYIFMRCNGYDFSSIVHKFSDDLYYNDVKVKDMLSSYVNGINKK